jgi:type III secretion system FlhB-like substrate exporter
MGAFATVQLPVDLTRCHDAAGVVLSVVNGFPGTRTVTLDAAASIVTFELHFPGNLNALIARLRDNIIPIGDHAHVSVPVESLVPELVADGPAAIAARVVEGAHVWDVAFARGPHVTAAHLEGGTLTATIVPGSEGMHQIYDALLSLGVVVNDLELAAARSR